MASTCLLVSFGLCFLVLFHASFAQLGRQQQQQPRLRGGRSECRIERITAREPNRRVESEAGVTEFWDSGNDELECAGVEVVRTVIQPKGLLLPYYSNAHQLIYVVRGRGVQGTVLPGCAETFETTTTAEQGGERRRDRHQRVYRYRQGDVLTLPAGAVHWTYNDGDTPIISVSLRDTSNVDNQLDRTFRKFFLAGNPERQEVQQGHQGRRRYDEPESRREEREGRHEGSRRYDEPEGRRSRGREEQAGNIFNGFDDEILQQVFNVDSETINQLKGQNDDRGSIVRADNFQVVSPQFDEREEEEEWSGREMNGFEETLCSVELRANIGHPARADVYNPRGGRLTSVNSHKLPVLNWVQLSAERGVLYKNAVLAPQYNLNAHTIIYVTRGSSRLQIVSNDGKPAFDGNVQEGQLIVVPQNFAVVKKANEQGCEWVAFKTNDNAITTQLAGRFSAIRALPEDVLVNSYDISREQARSLKYNRQEGLVFSPSSRSSSPRQKGLNALLNVLFN